MTPVLAERTIAIKPRAGGGRLRHQGRSFERPPSRDEAPSLLAELATAACRFAPVPTDMPLALYGAGNLGSLARDFLDAVGQPIVMVVDRNAQRIASAPQWSGIRLLHPQDVADIDKKAVRLAVSVATSPYVPLERALFEMGFEDVVPFYDLAETFRHLHPLSNGWFSGPLSTQDSDNTAEVMERWDDDVSRAHHFQFLAWRRLREEWTFDAAPIPACSRFFIPEVTSALHDHEFLLDAGAHHGSVTEAFIKQTNGEFRQIVAIEPDPANRAKFEVQQQSRLSRDSRVTVLDFALAQHEGEAPFHGGLGYASQLSVTGRTSVKVRPLDALGLSPTFIKLHLEGAELAALQGARQTLLAHRPIVTATVYHNADGIWRTARWLMNTLPDYRFLFRAHSWCGTGAVIYAIPNERAAS